MQYDLKADLVLLRTCNYRCDYCFLSTAKLGEKLVVHASPAEWQSAFDRTGKTWQVHITGGEPTLYPGLADLSARLSQRHLISLNSNLTGREVAGFADGVAPERVMQINAGYHPAERTRRNGHDVFVANVRLLRDRGFPIFISVVATPEVLAEYDDLVAALAPTGLMPMPKVLRGRYAGRSFPEAYTEAERQEFCRRSLTAEAAYADLFQGEALSRIALTQDREHLTAKPSYLGQLCAAGRDFIRIEPDGSVHRCGIAGPPMGNILRGDWKPKRKAKPCDRSYCFYECEEFTARARQDPDVARSPRRNRLLARFFESRYSASS